VLQRIAMQDERAAVVRHDSVALRRNSYLV